MSNNNQDIDKFLATSPTIPQILKFVEDSAQARVKEINAGQGEL